MLSSVFLSVAKFYQNVRWPAGDIVPQKLSTAANSCLRGYLKDRCRQCRRGVIFRPSPQGPGAATPKLTQIFDVFRLIV